ncbi:alpha/beta hydrolase [Streptomyces sp. NBC_00872]|uniref:alpha/beta hydrolase n=1 Tax=Streptomyces sp. NBC_00872 TaxID=2903686 RepID=UPI003864FD4F|nr:alpha/beta hydrolase [Streptomyces sp. NBC_00872]
MSIERKFAIGVAALCVGSWAAGARTRFLGSRRRMAAFSTMPRADGRVVEVDHRRPPGAEFGVIFFNGLGLPHEQWAWVREHLPGNAACVGYNRPGHGLSSPLPGATLEEQFRIVDELRERYLDGLPLVLAGHSIGGYLAAAYAASRRDTALSHVVMVDPTIISDLRANLGRLPDRWTRQRLLMECLWAATGLNILRPMTPVRELYAEEIKESLTAFHAMPRVWATAYGEYMAARVYPPVEKLGVPLHVVTALKGTRSAVRHRRSQERMLELSDLSWHHVRGDADHMGVVAEETYAKALAELIVPGSAA